MTLTQNDSAYNTKIAVLGTGDVGNAIASKVISLGYQVMMGSRTFDNDKAIAYVQKNGEKASHGTFEDAAKFGEIIFLCTSGSASVEVLNQAKTENLSNKIVVDISNPLDFSKGIPPTLLICNDYSLGEKIQTSFPNIKLVKTLNTLACNIMVNPNLINNGNHTIFMSGNDEEAKNRVKLILNSFDWKNDNIIDLGDITTARGTEMLLPIWLRIWGATGTMMFNFNIVK